MLPWNDRKHIYETPYGKFRVIINTATFEGRVFDATVASGQYGEFLAITIITNLVDGDEGITITFNDGNGLLKLHKQGYFGKGRRVHVTGAISGISEVYEKDGELHIRKRPQLTLDSKTVQVKLGAAPATDKPAAGTKVITPYGHAGNLLLTLLLPSLTRTLLLKQ